MKVFFKILLAALLPLNLAMAETMLPGEVFVSESQLGKYTCGLLNGKWLPGKLKKDGTTFNTILKDIEKQKMKLSLAPSSDKKALIQTKINSLKKKNNTGKKACKSGPTVSGPKGTPTYRPTATYSYEGTLAGAKTPTPVVRTPTPIPTVASVNFDSRGNVTTQGKITFQIPSNLSANIDRGRAVHITNNCTGCHDERATRSFTALKSRVPFSPMNIELSDQDFADLAAYLNRYRP